MQVVERAVVAHGNHLAAKSIVQLGVFECAAAGVSDFIEAAYVSGHIAVGGDLFHAIAIAIIDELPGLCAVAG